MIANFFLGSVAIVAPSFVAAVTPIFPQTAVFRNSRALLRFGLLALPVENDRDGPVVDELDLHPRAEDAAHDGDPFCLQRCTKHLVERCRLLRRRGVRGARPVALRRVDHDALLVSESVDEAFHLMTVSVGLVVLSKLGA